MGILDDLAMGFGFKEKDRDYYDRTEQTMRRTQGADARADQYNKYLGRTESGFRAILVTPRLPTTARPSAPLSADFRQVRQHRAGREPIRRAPARLRSDYQPGSAGPDATETSAARSPEHCRTC